MNFGCVGKLRTTPNKKQKPHLTRNLTTDKETFKPMTHKEKLKKARHLLSIGRPYESVMEQTGLPKASVVKIKSNLDRKRIIFIPDTYKPQNEVERIAFSDMSFPEKMNLINGIHYHGLAGLTVGDL